MNVSYYDSNYNFDVIGVSYIGEPKDGTVLFVKKKIAPMISNLEGKEKCLIFFENGIVIDEKLKVKNCFVESNHPDWDYYLVANKLTKDELVVEYKETRDGYYLGKDVQIGAGTYISPGCYIGNKVSIGENCVIQTGVKIENSIIGDNVIIRSNSVIGIDAFTLVKSPEGRNKRIPSFGKVLLGNDIDIGPLCAIYRGQFRDTIIGDTSIIDSGSIIGHDVEIGKGCVITGNCTIGGFAEIKRACYVGIGAIIKNRIVVESNSYIGMGSVCNQNVLANTVVFGNPARRIISPKD